MCATMVVTANPQPLSQATTIELIYELTTIVERHRNWSDPLSCQLRGWSIQLFDTLLDSNLPADEMESIGWQRVDDLATNVLVNPIPVQHQFAEQMTSLVDRVKACRSNLGSVKLSNYLMMRFANLAHTKGIQRGVRRAADDFSAEMDDKVNKSTKEREEGNKARRAAAKVEEAIHRENLESLLRAKDEEIRSLQEQNVKLEEAYQADMEDLYKQRDEQDQSNHAALAAIDERLLKTEQERREAVDHYQLQLTQLKQDREESEKRSEQQFREAIAQREAEAAINKQILAAQRAELHQYYEGTANLRADLLKEQQKAIQLYQHILALRHQLDDANSRINNIQIPHKKICIIQ